MINKLMNKYFLEKRLNKLSFCFYIKENYFIKLLIMRKSKINNYTQKERREFPAEKTKTSSNEKVITYSDSERENKKSVHENNENEIIEAKKSESKKKKVIISVIT